MPIFLHVFNTQNGPIYHSFGIGKLVDLSAVAAVTDGLSGAELELIVNEAAIRAVRRVSVQLSQGIESDMIDNSVYPQDFEESVETFFQNRHKNRNRSRGKMGFDIDQSTTRSTIPAIFRPAPAYAKAEKANNIETVASVMNDET